MSFVREERAVRSGSSAQRLRLALERRAAGPDDMAAAAGIHGALLGLESIDTAFDDNFWSEHGLSRSDLRATRFRLENVIVRALGPESCRKSYASTAWVVEVDTALAAYASRLEWDAVLTHIILLLPIAPMLAMPFMRRAFDLLAQNRPNRRVILKRFVEAKKDPKFADDSPANIRLQNELQLAVLSCHLNLAKR